MPGGDLAGPRCRRGHRRTGVAGRAPGRSRPCLPCLPPEPWDAGGGPLPSCPSSGPRATGRHTRSCLPLQRARASRRRQPLWLSCWRSTREQAGTLRSPVGERQALGTDDHGDQAAARAGETSVPHLSCLSPSKYSPLPPRPHTSHRRRLQPPWAVLGHHVLFPDPAWPHRAPAGTQGMQVLGGTRGGAAWTEGAPSRHRGGRP